jgi:hypothetical protein
MLTFGWSNAAYNPRTNRWRPLSPGPAGPSAVVWTRRQVLAWGGGCCGDNRNDGSAYDPATDTWRAIPPAPISGRHADGVWTGRELIVVGGTNNEPGGLTDGAAYNPTTRTWRVLPPLPALPGAGGTLTWTGTEVLLVGGHTWSHPEVAHRDALAYHPTTNRWRRLPDMPLARFGHAAVWTGRQLLVWGGLSTPYDERTGAYRTPAHGVAYTPATGQWSALPTAPLRGRTPSVAFWTGRDMIIWGGEAARPPFPWLTDGAAYRPAVIFKGR